ncbi:MAG: elongation factor EF-2 [Candidatus Thermoplasmatota archaeon]|nr:elongation factor EF-2 [Candidatus Thermoplasmatota archaeon]
MARREDMVKRAFALMDKPERIRNIGTAAHIDHGKTTLSDALIAGAGIISEKMAGKQLYMDFDEQEQARGITINSANVSMVYNYGNKDYLMNLIDTPGHVDFGGEVTRAMRAIDGVIIVDDAVEGVMPQTETVIRQALREHVKPVLFINKVDRLINELKISPEEMQRRFAKIISEVNELIKKFAPDEFKKEWQLRVEDGSVAFGSAFQHWAISVPRMKETNITFKDIYDLCSNGRHEELAKKSPAHITVLNMVAEHLPDPKEAQRYRIPKIWHGERESEAGRAMLQCDPDGPLTMMITKIIIDPHAGEIAVGRVYSGTLRRGETLYAVDKKATEKSQQIGVFMGPDYEPVEYIPSGNIGAISGLKVAAAGSTISSLEDLHPFERLVHISDPVVTLAIEPKSTKDLPRLVEAMRGIAKEDPSCAVEINQETGEYLLSGMGELHLEILTYRIIHDKKVDIDTSQPIVVYKESVSKKSPVFEGKSPNKHNRVYVEVEPLEEGVFEAIKSNEIADGRVKNPKQGAHLFIEKGMSPEDARNIVDVYNQNVLIDATKGIQYLNETMELLVEAFHEAVDRGPLANERVIGVKVRLMDAKLHEDAIHRGPAQMIPCMRSATYGAMLSAGPAIMEPKQRVYINIPIEYLGNVTSEMQQRRAFIEEINQEGEVTTVVAKAPVAEMFGFAGAIRSATTGRAIWSSEVIGFERLPRELQDRVIKSIRERKGLKLEPPTARDFLAD